MDAPPRRRVLRRPLLRLSTVVDAPIQNIYICKVEKVNGTLKDVPIKTYPNVQPWGTLPYKT